MRLCSELPGLLPLDAFCGSSRSLVSQAALDLVIPERVFLIEPASAKLTVELIGVRSCRGRHQFFPPAPGMLTRYCMLHIRKDKTNSILLA